MDKERPNAIEQTAIRASEVFNKLPLAYKRLITFSDWLMVLDGMKAATDYAFLGDTWDENEFRIFKQTLESAGVRVSDVKTQYFKDNIPFRSGHIYNAKALASQTAESTIIPPYDGSTTLDEYVSKLQGQGIPDGIIWGKIYSFPESAIQDYLKGSGHERTDTNRVTLGIGNETYWAYDPVQEDVIARENASIRFLCQIEQNSQMKRIYDSDELKASDAEWSRRLPEFTRRRNVNEAVETRQESVIQRIAKRLRSLRI